MDLKEWVHTPYHGKQYADSTLRGMKKEELIQIIRDYEHNYNALYEANERGIQAAIKMLAETDKVAECEYKNHLHCRETLMKQAADAIEERDKYALTLQHEMMAEAESHIALVERLNKRIEELELHYCPHAIRNVHDRGDDSICRVLGTEPPKEEKK